MLHTATRHSLKSPYSCVKVICHCIFVSLIVVLRPTREFFTHMETSPLPVKGCKF